jgi:hypothetical protein
MLHESSAPQIIAVIASTRGLTNGSPKEVFSVPQFRYELTARRSDSDIEQPGTNGLEKRHGYLIACTPEAQTIRIVCDIIVNYLRAYFSLAS